MPLFAEPNMSDAGLLVSVEDLINQAMGPQEMNVINFKLMQMVLHILARQQRLLEQRVEIRITDIAPPRHKLTKERIIEESESSSSKSPRSPKGRMSAIKEEREAKKDKALKEKERLEKEREKAEKLAQKTKEIEEREMDRAERAALKEKQKAQKLSLKEQEKLEKLERKEKEKAERQAQKDQEKAEKEKEKAEKLTQREKEKAEKLGKKEKDKAEKSQKEQEKTEKLTQKEQEKADKLAQKEKEKADKLSQKEQEKADKLAQKEKDKVDKLSLKEQEKAEKLTQKEQEKADKLAQKEQEKAEKLGQKEKDKAEKLSQKEKEKAEILAQKEKEKMEKAALKEKEKAEKAALKEKEKAEKSPREKKKHPSDSSIAISEAKRGKEKVLIVEKGPTTRPEAYSRGSIEVVTQSQFALLESAVKELKDIVAPPMPLKLPDNEKLRSDLAKGSASLQDTMRAMQIDARVLAAEQAITRMSGLLLAIAGTETEDLEGLLEETGQKRAAGEVEAGVTLKSRPSSARKSVLIDPSAKASEATGLDRLLSRMSTASMPRPSTSIMRRPSSSRGSSDGAGVTHDEMNESINELREDLIKAMNTVTNRATTAADNALYTAKNVADKLEVALSLDSRISTLNSLATDYAEQLHGFDAGLTTQMQSFREQMVQMRGDLKSGLTLLDGINNNAETAAVTELTERYQDLVTELDATLHAHRSLTKFQTQLANELHSLVECVEMLREQKADRDEVIDGLRDKADTSRLAGLLTESEFAMARADLERRLAVCHEKFQRQDNVWMTAIKDLNRITDGKSEIIDLLSARDELQKELQILHQRLQVLAAVLGEPNAAVIKRKLGTGAACAACGGPALMSPRDATEGAPPRLPALHAPPKLETQGQGTCFKDWMPPDRPDDRHVCRRWCGGSHTLVSESTRRGEPPPLHVAPAPTKRYTGYGSDGRLYMMEEDLQPCLECNEGNPKVLDNAPPLDLGAGDHNAQ